jgi:hypothetical protein
VAWALPDCLKFTAPIRIKIALAPVNGGNFLAAQVFFP